MPRTSKKQPTKSKGLTLTRAATQAAEAVKSEIKGDVDRLITELTEVTTRYWTTAKWGPTQKALALSRALTFMWAQAQSKIVEGMIFKTATAGEWTTTPTAKTKKKAKH